MTQNHTGDFGVYVHVPFCAQRCDYCAFATWTDRDHLMARYTEACVSHLEWDPVTQGRTATSVFFGGGTPSRLPATDLVAILSHIDRTDDCEVTVECNPEDVTDELVATYLEGGVNRISVGIQSTSPLVLADLGRRHGTGALHRVSEIFGRHDLASWNVDLIFGSQKETAAAFAATLDDVLGLDHAPPHVSCYALTAEKGTPLAQDPHRVPDDDVAADRYLYLTERLCEAGYEYEEISNFALPGHSCAHNNLYWRGGNYGAIGPAAHGHLSGRRFWNLRTPERYIAAVSARHSPVAAEEILDEATSRFERLCLELRTARGVDKSALEESELLEGLVELKDDRWVLTVRGRLMANAVSAYLVTEGNE